MTPLLPTCSTHAVLGRARQRSWEETPTLLDRWLPDYELRGVISTPIHASDEAIMLAYRCVTWAELPIASVVTRLRALAGRVRGRPRPPAPRPLVEQLSARHRLVLAGANHGEVVIGATPDNARIAVSLRVDRTHRRAERVVLEYRAQTLDRAAPTGSAAYVCVAMRCLGTAVGFLLLRAVKRRAESVDDAALYEPCAPALAKLRQR